ncbi:G-protein coupled receptor 1-like isoform X2 [Tasmannia lanceolata]|uniref:G-protein coupled receptor 1-like isoform X2 n=1 Tax=Tasmannia lanceolata TaxID=3420 RepID=UPI004063E14A
MAPRNVLAMAMVQASGNLTGKERRILTSVNSGASALSFGGSAFIVLCYLLFKELRKFSFKLVFFLALSDMFCSLFNIVGDPSKGFFCFAQGYSTHFFCVASFLWTTTIAFTLHRTVVRHKTDVEDLGPMFHLYVWGTSLAMTVMRLIGSDYGRLGAWCWTQTGRTGEMAVGMSERPHQFNARADMKALNRWGYYPLILIGSWAFGTVNRIHDFIQPGQKIFWLSFLDVGMAALMGLFNSIAYGLNSSVRRAICERLDLWWPERLRRWLPTYMKPRGQPQESELISLKVQDQQ